MRQQLIIEASQEGQGARMIWSESGGVTQERAARVLVRRTDLRQLFERRILQPIAQMPERILVRDQVNAQLAAAPIEQQNLFAGQRSPIAPNRFVVAISKGVFRVELEFVDLK